MASDYNFNLTDVSGDSSTTELPSELIPPEEERIRRIREANERDGISTDLVPESHTPEAPSLWDIIRFRYYRGWQSSPIKTALENLEISMSPNQELARTRLQLREKEELAESAPNSYLLEQIKQERGADSVGGTLGSVVEFGGNISDPLAASPIGRTLKTALGIGGVTGVGLSATYQYNEGPEVDMGEAIAWGVFGAGLGASFLGASKVNISREGISINRGGSNTVNPNEGNVIPEESNGLALPPPQRQLPAPGRNKQLQFQGSGEPIQSFGDFPLGLPAPQGQSLPRSNQLQFQGQTGGPIISGMDKPLGLPHLPPEPQPRLFQLPDETSGPVIQGIDETSGPPILLHHTGPLVEILGKERATSVVRATTEAPEVSPGFLDTLFKTNGVRVPYEHLKEMSLALQASKDGINSASKTVRSNFQNIGINTTFSDSPKLLTFENRIAKGKTWDLKEDQWQDLTVYSKGRINEGLTKLGQLKSRQQAEKQLTKLINDQAVIERNLNDELKLLDEEIYGYNPDIEDLDDYFASVAKNVSKVDKTTDKVVPKDKVGDNTYLINEAYWKQIGNNKSKYIPITDIKKSLADKGIPEKDIDEAIARMQGDRSISKMDLKKGPSIYMDKPLPDKYLEEAAQSWHKRRLERAAAISGETGGVDPRVLSTIAQAGVGGAVGYGTTGDMEGALAGAAIGTGIGPLTRMIMKGDVPYNYTSTIGDMKDWFNRANRPDDLADKVNRYTRDMNAISRVSVRLKNLGTFGHYFNTLLDHTYDNVQLNIADHLMKFDKILNKIPKSQREGIELQVANALEGKIKFTDLPPVGKELFNFQRKLFNRMAKDAQTYGIWKKEDLSKTILDNYFPRVMDVGKLQSKEGQEAFLNNFMRIGWSTKSLENTYKVLTGVNTSSAKAFVDSLRNSNGKLILSKSMARKFYQKAIQHEDVKTGSTHLDHKRTLNLGEYDNLMHTFRIRQFSHIASNYLHDVVNRIEHAKIFGANHERAFKLAANIADDIGSVNPMKAKNASEYSLKTFFNQLGMPHNGNVIEAHMNSSNLVKNVNGKVTAFEVLNLLFSQVLQPSAAFVNGATYMSRTMPLHQAFRTSFKSLQKVFSNDPMWKDFTSRAASGLNVGFIDNVSEATMEATLFGRSAFKDKYLSWINTPQGWFKFIKVIGLEKFNQRWATLQGRAMVEHIMDNRQKIVDGVITNRRVIDETKAIYDELGLDWDKSPSVQSMGGNATTYNDVHRAAMRFNRIVSFTDGARELPHVWRSPYATLARLFQTYMYRQSTFINDHVFQNGIMKGNLKPLAAYLAAATTMGWPVRELLEFVKGDDREYTNTVELLKNIETAAGYGRLFSLLSAASQGSTEFYRAVVGPAYTDALTLFSGARDTVVELDVKPLSEAVVDVLPRLPFKAKQRAAESLGIKERERIRQAEIDIYEYLKIDQKNKSRSSGGGSSVGMSSGMGLGLSPGLGL